MVQCKCVSWKICKLRKVFGVLREHVIPNTKRVEVRKMSEVF